MRPLKKNKWKIAAVALLSALTLAAVTGAFCFVRQTSFPAFCENLVKSSLSNNPVKLHYTLADPESMGYGGLPEDLCGFDADSYGNNTAVWQGYLERLERYDSEKLSEEEAFTWRILRRYFTLERELSTYLYYESPLSPADGTHIQMPVLLAEYTFYDREDVENYLTLLSQLPDYFRGLLNYMLLQAESGILQYEGNIETAAQQCESVLNKEQLAEGTHFMQTTFAERLEDLQKRGQATDDDTAELTDEDILELTERNEELLAELASAYQELAEGLREIPGTDQLTGLSGYPDGADYYALLLREATGSDRTVEEMKELLYTRFEELYEEYKDVVADGNPVSEYEFPLEDESEMLEDLYQRMREDFPVLRQAADRNAMGSADVKKEENESAAGTDAARGSASWTVTLKPVDEGLEEMMAPAFYLTPPVDQNRENTIYINLSDEYEGLSLYTTLAHEGFPGHLYQTVYSQNVLAEIGAPFIRQILYFGGYTEGWGIYAESYAYQYAADMMEQEYGDGLRNTILAAQLNRELQLCLCSILDIFIHYDGASLAQTRKLLQSLGFGSGDISAVYEAICNSPANYPKYYVGYLEILELKKLALENGAALTDQEFHRWLLSAGPADFTSLREGLVLEFAK